MIRKNKKFIDPRYFMEEKVEGGPLDQLDEMAMGPEARGEAEKATSTAGAIVDAEQAHEEFVWLTDRLLYAINQIGGVYVVNKDLATRKDQMHLYNDDISTLYRALGTQAAQYSEELATMAQEPLGLTLDDKGIAADRAGLLHAKYPEFAKAFKALIVFAKKSLDIDAMTDIGERAGVKLSVVQPPQPYFDAGDIEWLSAIYGDIFRLAATGKAAEQ